MRSCHHTHKDNSGEWFQPDQNNMQMSKFVSRNEQFSLLMAPLIPSGKNRTKGVKTNWTVQRITFPDARLNRYQHFQPGLISRLHLTFECFGKHLTFCESLLNEYYVKNLFIVTEHETQCVWLDFFRIKILTAVVCTRFVLYWFQPLTEVVRLFALLGNCLILSKSFSGILYIGQDVIRSLLWKDSASKTQGALQL